MKYSAIIPAAGKSIRFGKTNKLMVKINGVSVIQHTISYFLDDIDCEKIILVVEKENLSIFKKMFCLNKKIIPVPINSFSRSESVKFGFQYCSKNQYIIVHDACRPYLIKELIESIKIGVQNNDVCVPVIKISDSVINLQPDGILKYVNRNNFLRVQTPQAFTKKILDENYQILGNKISDFNDEFSQIISWNPQVKFQLIDGSNQNIKITYQDDINEKTK